MLNDLKKDLEKLVDKERAALLQKFFKTGKGEYGEGDVFIGLTVPQVRSVAIKYNDLPLKDIEVLIKSLVHEERLLALFILILIFKKNKERRKEIYDFYLNHTKYINNWDLVDLSSHEIVGVYLLDKPKDVLLKLATSKSIWDKRIAMISTFEFIRDKDFNTSIKIAEMLVEDREDLIQKAVGWMLREIGKRDFKTEEDFLKRYYKQMGRTALRYSIEKFPEELRLKYLHGTI